MSPLLIALGIPKPLPLPEGGGHRNALPLYEIPNARILYDFIPAMPLRVSALRSLGAYMNIFSIESFMDELTQASGADPVEFRLRHLTDPRARDVVTTVVIADMPDAQSASVISLVAAGGGGIQDMVTTQTYTTAEARDLFEPGRKDRRVVQTDGSFVREASNSGH